MVRRRIGAAEAIGFIQKVNEPVVSMRAPIGLLDLQ